MTLFVITLGVLSTPAAAAGAGVLDEVALRHEIKVTYCLEQRGKRFYRTENLDDLCSLKVAFFDDLVSFKMLSSVVLLSLNDFYKCSGGGGKQKNNDVVL